MLQVGSFVWTKNKFNLHNINRYKSHLISQFCKFREDLKLTP